MRTAGTPEGLAAVAGRDARVLILGSFPSVISLERQQYYANPRNQFWQIMGQLFEFEPGLPYPLRCRKLLEHGIALWDVCESAQRTGSLDATIDLQSVIPNDLGAFVQEHPHIELVAMNGRTAAGILDRLALYHQLLRARRILPSTSPAHAAMPIGEKVLAWSIVRDPPPSSSKQCDTQDASRPPAGRPSEQAHDLPIIGVDCSTDAKKTGLALADVQGRHLVIRAALCASKQSSAAAIAAEWIGSVPRALLALDAPLGWPELLGRELAVHSAGQAIESPANALFRRLTDDEIWHRLRKRSLDVGASWIARTARAALEFLKELQGILHRPVELLWAPTWAEGVQAIEVYPAATRISLGVSDRGGSLQGLSPHLRFRAGSPPKSPDARDAVVCALAAAEFLAGRAIGPTAEQESRARKEGWIWAGAAASPRGGGRSGRRVRRQR
jgi:hypoxanthine-DNA glycosylase